MLVYLSRDGKINCTSCPYENESLYYSVYCSGPKTLPKYNNKASNVDGTLKSLATSLFSKALQLYCPVCQVTGE